MKKSMLKKIVAFFLVSLIIIGSLAGCESLGGDDSVGSVFWLNLKPESEAAIQKLASMFKKETGIEVTVLTAAPGTYSDVVTAQMSKENSPTLFVVGKPSFVAAWSDYCLDLKDTKIFKELNTDDYMLYDEEGKLCSIAYCYECYGIIVNKALLKKAGYDENYIKDFNTLKKVTEDVHNRSEELGFDAFTSSSMEPNSSWRFTGHLANIDYYYESEASPENWAKCPRTITGAYLENYRKLYDLMVENSATDRKNLTMGGLDAAAEFTQGKALFYLSGSWEWPGLEEKGMKAEDLVMIPYYCGMQGEEFAGLNCGTENYWAVNSKASVKNQQATLDFMYWMVTDPEASAIAVETFGAMPYKQAAKSTNPFLLQAADYVAEGRYPMKTMTTYQPNADDYRKGLVSALNEYNENPSDETWEKFKTAFVDGWTEQYDKAYC